MMRLFTCVDHASVWVGGASIVVASSENEARLLLSMELTSRHLEPGPFTLKEVSLGEAGAIVLRDGDY